ncbi:MAG: histone deacetylase [Archaeoglobus sp.]|nr:MAG: histone deacetylase [Archaeoglobus sp.]
MRTALVFHKSYLEHEQTPTHPERRERLAYTLDQFMEEGIFDSNFVKIVSPEIATEKDVLAVHTQNYLDFLKKNSRSGGVIDWDTVIPVGLYEGAMLAAGGAITAAKLVADGIAENAFAMVRPPGHHAKPQVGAGFCYLNNIAIAVKWLQRERGYRRILILDWDAHHGDGTQWIFYRDPTVLFISLHQMPLYPGTGYPEEVGEDEGEGYTINVPLPPGSGDECYLMIFEEIVKPVAYDFRPELIAISAGQDNHFTDPLTSLALTARGYAELMKRTKKLAEELCDGKMFAVLEGGYSVEGALPYTNLAIVAAMAGLDTECIREPENYMSLLNSVLDPNAKYRVRSTVEKVKKIQSKYWGCFIR